MKDKIKELTKTLIEMNKIAQKNLEKDIEPITNQCPYYDLNFKKERI